jgi:hypothetical protein
MRTTAVIRALVLGAATLATAGAASAETVSVVCRVMESKGPAHRELTRRIDVDLQTKMARFADNAGRGWQSKGEHPIVSASRDRIVLDAGGGKDSYIDRVSGQYFLHNQTDHVVMRGSCQKAPPERPRF